VAGWGCGGRTAVSAGSGAGACAPMFAYYGRAQRAYHVERKANQVVLSFEEGCREVALWSATLPHKKNSFNPSSCRHEPGNTERQCYSRYGYNKCEAHVSKSTTRSGEHSMVGYAGNTNVVNSRYAGGRWWEGWQTEKEGEITDAGSVVRVAVNGSYAW